MNRTFSTTIVSVLAAWLCCIGCASTKGDNIVFKDDRVVIREKTSVLPHGTGDRVLEAKGRTFKNLYSNRYLWIPEWNSILFVTHREGSAYELHVFSFETKRDIAIETKIPFGSDMGRVKTDKLTCFVEKVDGNLAILIERSYKSPDIRYELDWVKKSLSSSGESARFPVQTK